MAEGTIELYRDAYGEIVEIKVGEEEVRDATPEEKAVYDEAMNYQFVDGR